MSQTPKKIVSREAYIKAKVKRLLLITLGLTFLYFAVLDNTIDRILDHAETYTLFHPHIPYVAIIKRAILVAAYCNLIMPLGLFWAGIRTIKKARRIDPGVPLIRANTADLPADESLVRASEQPATPQQSVLLRPAVKTQDSHEEQLLRASAGE